MKTDQEATVAAIKVGVNQFLGAGGAASIKQAIADRPPNEAGIDAAIQREFKTIIKLGLLDPPALVPCSRIGAPGETRAVQVPLAAASPAWWNEKRNGWEVEAGPVRILAGASSAGIRLRGTVNVGN